MQFKDLAYKSKSILFVYKLKPPITFVLTWAPPLERGGPCTATNAGESYALTALVRVTSLGWRYGLIDPAGSERLIGSFFKGTCRLRTRIW